MGWRLIYRMAVRLAYEAAAKEDLEKLEELEDVLDASKIPMELREASRKLGSRFVKTLRHMEISWKKDIFQKYQELRRGKVTSHPCAYGVFCCAAGIPLDGHKLCKDHSSEPVRGTEDPSLPPPGSGRSSFSCDYSGRRNVLRFCPRL